MFRRTITHMKTLMTAAELIAFEKRIADIYNTGQIKAPVHLSWGNEEQLIKIFKEVNEEDWLFTTWRSHYHCLLKGVPPDLLERDIMEGRSITLNYPEQKILSSAIVGGIIPIALGVALGVKRREGTERVWCFVGDMTATTGIFHEAWKYACGHDLPIEFIIEDNGKSVGTPTLEVWGIEKHPNNFDLPEYGVYSYGYGLPWPHAGAGQWVKF